jgi:hypothetical protein
MLAQANKTIDFFRDSAPWQMEAIQAGRDGGHSRQVWQSLADLIEQTWEEISQCHGVVMEHGPSLSTKPDDLAKVLAMINHLEAGGSFGLFTKLKNSAWFELIGRCRISNRPLDPGNRVHLRAIQALLQIQACRERLIERWDRQMASQGAPTREMLGDKPENVCRQFVPQIRNCLEWHAATWKPLDAAFGRLGFRWFQYVQSTVPQVGPNAELERLRQAVVGDLGKILHSRSCNLRQTQIRNQLGLWEASLGKVSEAEATVLESFAGCYLIWCLAIMPVPMTRQFV